LGTWYYRLADDACTLPLAEKEKYKKAITAEADSLIQKMAKIPYIIPIDEFQWGSNSDVIDASMLFCMAWKVSKDKNITMR